MPKSKAKSDKKDGTASRITDPRFANFETDPRYQLPSKKKLKTKLDSRFSKVLKDEDFISTAKVDRYGRKLKSDSKKKALQRLYEGEDEDDLPKLESDVEVDDDDIVRRELAKADKKYDPARDGGFSSSESDSDSSDSDSESSSEVAEDDEEEETRPGIRLRRDKEVVEEGEVTRRFAVVNMDWDHIKSVDLMALFTSFLPPGGRIEKVSIYPSEFGKERMQREDLEGPPKEIFKKSKASDDSSSSDSDSDSDSSSSTDEDSDEEVKKELLKEGDDQDFDSDALRAYQLERLRYYYAVVVCSDKDTAHKLYEATDGTEYLSSSNFLDLRFIPDDVTFDDEPRDECDSVPAGYKPIEFVTDALQHSKVKLTWDMHPEELARKETIRKAFTGSRADLAENDLRAYLASDTDSDDEDIGPSADGKDNEEAKLSKKELARRKLRAALGLPDDPIESLKPSKDGPVGEMQITFTPALSEKPQKEDVEETTIEKYKRKERERKEKRKLKALAKKQGVDLETLLEEKKKAEEPVEDLGFDDPFFTTEPTLPSKSALRKQEKQKKRAAREKEEAEDATQRAQLELLMADENGDGAHLDHFDMKEIMRAEKKGKKKKKGKKGEEDRGGLQEDFKMDVDDPRFKAVFESHEFAIDPSNPKFKATTGMKKLLEEGRKKRKAAPEDIPGVGKEDRSSKKAKQDDLSELSSLVNAVKKKVKANKV
ncbi:uncharacterized protein CTHT_0036060 [Thermochaetoides thermophila DSM 1495]|uniref:Uncharacterized protein n=1 Tax=Chaetomium thermophilum (strain DSM 1495 / CBS 144.50 / IMI 039719) TaxID=759272 RepID=G0S795_CHATD|nr:hypothetical protein CTHT_0036060 [Thermochaetoides thermophila DSM 1495]EGS21739.1 hypothetical protein CTHT_0036060 [Thermochaetoides thermophila DSM 1495]